MGVNEGATRGRKGDLGEFLAIALGVHGGFSEDHRTLGRLNAELIVEGVMPDLISM